MSVKIKSIIRNSVQFDNYLVETTDKNISFAIIQDSNGKNFIHNIYGRFFDYEDIFIDSILYLDNEEINWHGIIDVILEQIERKSNV